MKKEYLCAAVTIILWGSSAAVCSLLLQELNTVVTLLYACAIAFLFLLVTCTVKGSLKELKSISVREWFQLLFYGLFGMLAYNLFLFYGMTQLKTQQAFVINYLWPICIVILSCLMLGEKLTGRKIISMLLSLFGVAVVATEGNFSDLAGLNVWGILACIGAAVSYGLFSVMTMTVKRDKFLAMMIYYGETAVICLLIALVCHVPIPALESAQWPAMLWSGILVYGVAYTLWAVALDGADTSKISNLAYLTPFLSLVWIFFLLGEPIHISCIIGLLFIIAGVILQLTHKTE